MKEYTVVFYDSDSFYENVTIECKHLDQSAIHADVLIADGVRISFTKHIEAVLENPVTPSSVQSYRN